MRYLLGEAAPWRCNDNSSSSRLNEFRSFFDVISSTSLSSPFVCLASVGGVLVGGESFIGD